MAKKKPAAVKKVAKKLVTKKTTAPDKKAVRKGASKKAAKKAPKKQFLTVPKVAADPQIDAIKMEIQANWDVLNMQRIKAEEVLDRWRSELLSIPGVTGCHVGLRRVKKKVVFPLSFCIRVHIAKKLQPDHPRLMSMLPAEKDGVGIDIHEASYRLAAGGAPGDTYEPEMVGGIAIAYTNTPADWGTLGMCVTSNGKLVMLTNQHVAGDDNNEIVQPPSKNVPTGTPLVGTVITGVRNAAIDCAIIEPIGTRPAKPGIKAGAAFLPGKFEIGDLDIFDQLFRTAVFKIGAATGGTPIRMGRVRTISGSVTVKDFGSLINQILVDSADGKKIIEGGDSGSILIKQAGSGNSLKNLVVGLVTAEMDGGKTLVASHFRAVSNKLGISVS